MLEALKNCPFCDASDSENNACQEAGVICLEVPTAVGAKGWQVVCRCGASSPKQLTEAEAIAAWNRRALQAVGPEPAVADENRRLRAVISKVCEALPNGAFCSPNCTIEFMEEVPSEVASVISALVATPPAERSADPEFETAPDNGTPDEVLAYVLDCAKRWVPEARIIGNARAGDIERALSSAPARADGWRDMSEAPKDGTKILVYYDAKSDPYVEDEKTGRLTPYGAHSEGGDFLDGSGITVAVWVDGWHESEDEYGSGYWMPGWWFAWFNGDTDLVVAPTGWLPLSCLPAATTATGGRGDE